jgi:hypothetical protein
MHSQPDRSYICLMIVFFQGFPVPPPFSVLSFLRDVSNFIN